MGISTVGKAWDCTQEMSTTVLGLRVQTLLGIDFFAEFICSNTILALILASMYLTFTLRSW